MAATKRRLRYFFLILAGVGAIIGCLDRGGLDIALIGGVGILVAANHRRIVFATFLALLILFVMIGTLGNYFLTVYLALNLGSFSSEELISENIAEGTPDVTE